MLHLQSPRAVRQSAAGGGVRRCRHHLSRSPCPVDQRTSSSIRPAPRGRQREEELAESIRHPAGEEELRAAGRE
jgi:hypothetical protein